MRSIVLEVFAFEKNH